jgi:threonine dehydrogenase-like Zn-dependent dehydrogenase
VTAHATGRRYERSGPRTGRLVTTAVPDPGVGQILLQVEANGVCASELPTWHAADPPVSLGHEPVGTVIAAGAGVDLRAGTRVTGRVAHSFADFVAADARDVVEVPEQIASEHALGEPLGCVVEGLRRARIQPGDHVAVIGLGFMGLCTLQLAVRSIAAHVAAIDIREDMQGIAASLGADATYHPEELSSAHRGVDMVIEASGTQPGLDLATELVRPHGTISILGYHQDVRQIDLQAWNWKAIDVVNAHVRDRDLLRESTRRGLALVAANRITMEPLITHRFGLDEVDQAFAALQTKPPGFIKAVIVNERGPSFLAGEAGPPHVSWDRDPRH